MWAALCARAVTRYARLLTEKGAPGCTDDGSIIASAPSVKSREPFPVGP